MSQLIRELRSDRGQLAVVTRTFHGVALSLMVVLASACDTDRPVAPGEEAVGVVASMTLGERSFQVGASVHDGFLHTQLPIDSRGTNTVPAAGIPSLPVNWSAGKIAALARGARIKDGNRQLEIVPSGKGSFQLRFSEGGERVEVTFGFAPSPTGFSLRSLRAVTFDGKGAKQGEVSWDLNGAVSSQLDTAQLAEALQRAVASLEDEEGPCSKLLRTLLLSAGGMTLSAASGNGPGFIMSAIYVGFGLYDYAACMEANG